MFLTALTALSLSYVSLLLSRTAIYQMQYAHYVFITIAVLTVYLLVLLRLEMVFIDTQFSISAKKIYFHITNIILMLSAIIAAILDYLWLYPWNTYFYTLIVILYIIGNSHLAYCFNHNLFLLYCLNEVQ